MSDGKSCGKCAHWEKRFFEEGECTCERSDQAGHAMNSWSGVAKYCDCYERRPRKRAEK